jgi:glycosyltransferase involved in cell wall biosynthesis
MRFSIIVPVLNEEAVLEDQLICLTRQCTHHTCEVLIVHGESHDGTGEIAKRYRKVIAAPRGRATQMNAGAEAASGDVLMFLHADSFLPDNAFRAIESALASPGSVAGAFRLCFTCGR